MAYTREFVSIIENTRKHKNISVKALCENITSERTYYRLVNEDSEAPFNMLVKLANKLKLNLNQIMVYIMYFGQNYAYIYTFLYRIQIEFYDDIKDHYEGIKKQVFDNESERLLALAYIKRYEFSMNEIPRSEYEKELKRILDSFDNPTNNILRDLVEVHYMNIKEHSQEEFIQFATKVANYHNNLSLHFQTMVLEELLFLVSVQYEFDPVLFKRLYTRFKLISSKFTINHYVLRNHLFEAFVAKYNNDLSKRDDELYIAMLMLNYMYGGDQLKMYFQIIGGIHDLNIYEFMASYSKKELLKRLEIELI